VSENIQLDKDRIKAMVVVNPCEWEAVIEVDGGERLSARGHLPDYAESRLLSGLKDKLMQLERKGAEGKLHSNDIATLLFLRGLVVQS
jgi:hypothetical protein